MLLFFRFLFFVVFVFPVRHICTYSAISVYREVLPNAQIVHADETHIQSYRLIQNTAPARPTRTPTPTPMLFIRLLVIQPAPEKYKNKT